MEYKESFLFPAFSHPEASVGGASGWRKRRG